MATTGTITDQDGHAVPLIEKATFLPAAIQDQSKLVQCPAEIRLMIMRELLVADAPIDRRKWMIREQPGPNGKYRDKRGRFSRKLPNHAFSYGLSPAILGTCQTLLQEGWQVLYHENTLVLKTHLDYASDHTSDILLFGCSGCIASIAFGGTVAKRDPVDPRPRPPWCLTNQWSLRRFGSFSLRIDPTTKDTLENAIRALVGIMQEKSLKVHMSFPIGMTLQQKIWQLKSFQLMKCRKLRFMPMEGLEQAQRQVQKVAESSKQVVDLTTFLSPLRECLQMVGRTNVRDTSVYEKMSRRMQELQHSTYDFDILSFQQHRMKFMKLFKTACRKTREKVHEGDKDLLALAENGVEKED